MSYPNPKEKRSKVFSFLELRKNFTYDRGKPINGGSKKMVREKRGHVRVVKVMLNLSKDITERSTQLTSYVARNALRGSASRADVMRKAIALGLEILEKRQAKEEGDLI